MARQLQIKDGKAVSEWCGSGEMPVPPDETWTFVDVTDNPSAQCGDSYDTETNSFAPPPAPPDYGATVNPREFLLLFTATQRKATRQAAKSDQDVEDVLALTQVPVPIRLKHPVTIAGLNLLVSKGLITNADKLRIMENQAPA